MIRLGYTFITISMLVFCQHAMSQEPDWSTYNHLLSQYVHHAETELGATSLVDYDGLKSDNKFYRLIHQIENYDLQLLDNKEERLSFYINAYNIFALRMVVKHWPIDSIKDIGSFFSPVWKKTVGKINHRSITLHALEHDILRKMEEPRIHFAINCASLSCPNLIDQAYTAEKLEQQLEAQTKQFLSNPHKGVQVKDNQLYVSKIFSWFEDDFAVYGGVVPFIGRHLNLSPDATIDGYLDYNWQVNAIPN